MRRRLGGFHISACVRAGAGASLTPAVRLQLSSGPARGLMPVGPSSQSSPGVTPRGRRSVFTPARLRLGTGPARESMSVGLGALRCLLCSLSSARCCCCLRRLFLSALPGWLGGEAGLQLKAWPVLALPGVAAGRSLPRRPRLLSSRRPGKRARARVQALGKRALSTHPRQGKATGQGAIRHRRRTSRARRARVVRE